MKAVTTTVGLLMLIVASALFLFADSLLPQPALAQTQHIAQQSNAAAVDLVMAQNSIAAYNWAGYVADTDSYSGVSAEWIVPAVGVSANGADATWVGIGGVSTNDLIQAGTEALPNGAGGTTYAAWLEVLPQDSQMVPLHIAPGDSVSVTISRTGQDLWLISFQNNTTGQSYERRVAYQSSLSSAEWIEEMPVSPDSPIALDDFGSVRISNAYALVAGKWTSIAKTGAKALRMDNGEHEALALPTKLTAGGVSFSVVRTKAAAKPLQYSNGSVVPPSQTTPEPPQQESFSAVSLLSQLLGK